LSLEIVSYFCLNACSWGLACLIKLLFFWGFVNIFVCFCKGTWKSKWSRMFLNYTFIYESLLRSKKCHKTNTLRIQVQTATRERILKDEEKSRGISENI
jgi:hypothetical protein